MTEAREQRLLTEIERLRPLIRNGVELAKIAEADEIKIKELKAEIADHQNQLASWAEARNRDRQRRIDAEQHIWQVKMALWKFEENERCDWKYDKLRWSKNLRESLDKPPPDVYAADCITHMGGSKEPSRPSVTEEILEILKRMEANWFRERSWSLKDGKWVEDKLEDMDG